MRWLSFLLALTLLGQSLTKPRARDLGLSPGRMPPGLLNAITDVPGTFAACM